MSSLVNLIPVGATKKTGGSAACWEAPSGKAWFDITIPGGVFPSGWVSLQGSLIRHGGDYDARLYYDLGKGFSGSRFFEIPTSAKGVINELIRLPAGITSMKFSPMGTAGEFELGPMTITMVNALERRWRMACRVVAMMFLHPGWKRRPIRLNFFRMLVDLQGAYCKAGKLLAHAPAPDYPTWIARFDTLDASDQRQIEKHIDRFASRPHFYLLLVTDGATQAAIQKTLDSFRGQLFGGFTCVALGGGTGDSDEEAGMKGIGQGAKRVARDHVAAWLEQFNATLAGDPAGKWVMLLRAGDVLAPHALYRFACEALADPTAAVVYSDDDVLDASGQRCQPRFKPDWSLAHFRSTNFVGEAVALRGSEVAAAGGVNLDCCLHGSHDLLLRVVDAVGDGGAGRVAHIPAVLLHRGDTLLPSIEREWNEPQWCMAALQAHLVRNEVSGEVAETLPGCRRVRYSLPVEPPLVSVIVPTRDELALIRQCVEGLLANTTYPRFEILVVDNQSANPDALAYLEQIARHEKVRVLKFDQPFNYSAMNNMAIGEARGEAVCLLNNDTEVISPDWLEEMVGHLLQPKVGVVGAKLYYPNGQVQHGGVLVGVGSVANHAHAFLQRDDPGYCNRAAVAQELSAVTGACMLVWKSLYEELHGLDERHLPVTFNDVDFCLRVRGAGYRVVWTPHAELYHHEKVSRGKDQGPDKIRLAKREVAYMCKCWKRVVRHDPFYNPNLSYERPDFSLSNAPVAARP